MKTAHVDSKYRAQLVHHIPGRLRVRLPHGDRRPRVMERLKHDLLIQSGIYAVDVNRTAGSVTAGYDPHQHSSAGILGLLEDLAIITGTVLDVPRIEQTTSEKGLNTVALSLSAALDDLNYRLSAWTGNVIDLRVLFPLSLVGLGLWQIRKHGLMLEMLPGWLLVWFGFDAFLKLRVHHGSGEQPVLSSARV